MALLLCLMLLQQHTHGPSLVSLVPSTQNDITTNSFSTINQPVVPLPSIFNNDTYNNHSPSTINKTAMLSRRRDVSPNENQSPAPLPAKTAMDPSFADAFHPSIAVIIGLLSTMFALSFLVLLYAKHCKRIPMSLYEERDIPSLRYHLNYYHHYEAGASGSAANAGMAPARINSGIDRYVLECLPRFPFAVLKGMKDGLECAVCLSKYESTDILRLLPTCKHAFHLDCIDLWLLHHSTCPLCRHKVEDDEDALSISHSQELEDFLSRYKPWGGQQHEESARVPTVWGHSDRISQGGGGHSSRISAMAGHSSRRTLGGSGSHISGCAPQHGPPVEPLETSTLEFHLQRDVECVDDTSVMCCNNGSDSWRKLEGVPTECSGKKKKKKKNDMEEGVDEWAFVEGQGKEGHMQRWALTKGMVMMRRRVDESWRRGGDKYYDEEVMKRLRHRINIVPLFSTHTIPDNPTSMEHHHYSYGTGSCTHDATTRCMSEISCRHQIGSL